MNNFKPVIQGDPQPSTVCLHLSWAFPVTAHPSRVPIRPVFLPWPHTCSFGCVSLRNPPALKGSLCFHLFIPPSFNTQLPPPLQDLPSDKGAGLRPVCPLPSAKLPITPQPQAKFSIVLGKSRPMMIDNDDDNVLDLIIKTANTLEALSMCQELC